MKQLNTKYMHILLFKKKQLKEVEVTDSVYGINQIFQLSYSRIYKFI